MSHQVSPLSPTKLDLSGTRFGATYELSGDLATARDIAEQLVVEQTIEFPRELVPDDDIQRHVVGQIHRFEPMGAESYRLEVRYALELTGGLITQLFNVLFGNISMVPGVKLVDAMLPDELLADFAGPSLGISGLRNLFSRPRGPLLATALKPMGTPVPRLAEFAYELATSGIDLIKEDHSFATQSFHSFSERVPALADAVRRGAEKRGHRSVFLPAFNVPFHEIGPALELSLEVGAGGALVLPGLSGYDTMRWVAENSPDDFVVQSHPAFLGSFVSSPESGISHDVLFGLFPRLAGADVSIFPNFGGRFGFSATDCAQIAERCRAPLGGIAPCWPAPAGGMSVGKVDSMIEFYGSDTALLIGGGLYRGSIAEQVKRMVDAALEGK